MIEFIAGHWVLGFLFFVPGVIFGVKKLRAFSSDPFGSLTSQTEALGEALEGNTSSLAKKGLPFLAMGLCSLIGSTWIVIALIYNIIH